MKERDENLLWVLIIVLCLAMVVRLLLGVNDYDCSSCIVEFKSEKNLLITPGQEFTNKINYSAIELFVDWSRGVCPVRFSDETGYYKDG